MTAWVMRPSLDEIGTRADAAIDAATKREKPKPLASPLAGDLVCVLDLARSRVTVSSTADLALNWREDGCADGRTQFANGSDGWLRVSVPGDDETVTVASFDPANGTYQAERYLLDYETMTRLRAEQGKQPAGQCGGTEAARQTIASQLALKAMLPAAPNERLVYACSKALAAQQGAKQPAL